MYQCDRCGKGAQFGMNVSHSHRRTKKRSLPNLHKVTLFIGGKRQTQRLCTKCLRLEKKKAIIKPKEKIIDTKPEVEKKEPQAISEGKRVVTSKPTTTGTLSEAIEKSADKTAKKEKVPAKTSKS